MIFRRSQKLEKKGKRPGSLGLIAAVLCICFLLSSCSKTKNIELNILCVENRKFQELSEEDIHRVTTLLKKDMRKFFGINVQTVTIEKMDIEDYLKNEYRPKVDMGENYKITQIMRVYYEKLKFIKDNKERSKVLENQSIKDIAQEIINKNKEVLKMLGIEKGNRNEYAKYSLRSWHERLKKIKKYDLVIYNGILIDDYEDAPLHTLIRGFIAFGYAVKNNSKYKGAGMVATLPIMSTDLPFSKWRDGHLSDIEKIKSVSLMTCHELGHMLFDYDDEYSHDDCIMNPVKGYDFKSALSTKKCKKMHPNLHYSYSLEKIKF